MESHEWQLVNLELSKKLKELGVKQESLWYWGKEDDNSWGLIQIDEDDKISEYYNEYISAFTVAELGEMLPRGYRSGRAILKEKEYYICYGKAGTLSADTEANARAKMRIYLIENKKIGGK